MGKVGEGRDSDPDFGTLRGGRPLHIKFLVIYLPRLFVILGFPHGGYIFQCFPQFSRGTPHTQYDY